MGNHHDVDNTAATVESCEDGNLGSYSCIFLACGRWGGGFLAADSRVFLRISLTGGREVLADRDRQQERAHLGCFFRHPAGKLARGKLARQDARPLKISRESWQESTAGSPPLSTCSLTAVTPTGKCSGVFPANTTLIGASARTHGSTPNPACKPRTAANASTAKSDYFQEMVSCGRALGVAVV